MSFSETPDPSGAHTTSSSSPPASTPSPSASSGTTAPSTNASRRPPRKSTLTQQQKNNKRQRATQDQLVTLEVEFNKNPTPTAATRERIASDINMTERSVQIWFQNRRAKIKMLAKKSIETGEGCDSIPESMRHYLAMQFDPSKPGTRDPFGRSAGYGSPGMYASESTSGKVVISHFTCRSLTIGSWRRIGQNAMDLVIFYSPDKACMTYYINNDSAGYKIEYPFAHIKNITLETGDPNPGPNGQPPRPGGLVVELNRPPMFYMDSSNSGGFYQCGDFTEEQQASQIMVHHLGGHPKVLSVQLAKLVSLESFQNRLAYGNSNNNGNFAVPAAMSPPFIQRPASQPNHFAPPPYMNPYQDQNRLGFNMPAARGHKRQRSRSVPVAVDISVLQGPMASFHHMPQTPAPYNPAESGIYAPVPQSAHALPTDLRIDTDGYGLDFKPNPMSATTTASPSDFASPSMYSSAAQGDSTPVANMPHQFSVPQFVSTGPSDSSTVGSHTASPYSGVSPADPMIANHSPPLSNMSHSSSDIYGFSHDQQSGFVEDGLSMNDMYSKHNVNYGISHDAPSFELPMHGISGHGSPALGDYSHGMVNLDEINSQGLPTGGS